MKLKHKETGGVFETTEGAALYWEQLGWEQVSDDTPTTADEVTARMNPNQFAPVGPEELAAATARDAARAVGVDPDDQDALRAAGLDDSVPRHQRMRNAQKARESAEAS